MLIFDEKSGFPLAMQAGAPPIVEMRFRNLKLVDRADLPEGAFEYTPPDGVPVMDLGSMAKSAE